jgi:hypothetical protein
MTVGVTQYAEVPCAEGHMHLQHGLEPPLLACFKPKEKIQSPNY